MPCQKILWFGGESEERMVSVASAQNLVREFPFDAIYFWTPDARVYQEKPESLLSHTLPFTEAYSPKGQLVYENGFDAKFLSSFQDHLVFLGFHGGIAENGNLQAQLEKHHIFFTASGSLASHKAFNKSEAKALIKQLGGRVPKGEVLSIRHNTNWKDNLRQMVTRWGEVVIKPNASGSSFGLYFISNLDELETVFIQLESGSHHFSEYLCEERVKGRELTVGFVEQINHPKEISLPPSEVLLENNFNFDYQGKYLGKGVKEVTPADLTPKQVEKAQFLSKLAHKAVGAYGYSRTDMILTPDDEMVFLEINTLPGLSRASFIPQQLEVARIRLTDFIEVQLALAQCRYRN